MTDGQSETCESIQQQSRATCERLEPGKSVKWHDGEQWRVGVLLTHKWLLLPCLVQTVDGTYVVERAALTPYGPRCEACGGEGTVYQGRGAHDVPVRVDCPACGGSGRRP